MNKKGIILIVIFVILVVVAVSFIFLKKSGSPSSSQTNSGSGQLPPPTKVEVPFEYTVTSVSSSAIILTGQQGDLTLTPDITTIYKGDRGSTTKTDTSALLLGKKVNVDLVPGRSATIWILQ